MIPSLLLYYGIRLVHLFWVVIVFQWIAFWYQLFALHGSQNSDRKNNQSANFAVALSWSGNHISPLWSISTSNGWPFHYWSSIQTSQTTAYHSRYVHLRACYTMLMHFHHNPVASSFCLDFCIKSNRICLFAEYVSNGRCSTLAGATNNHSVTCLFCSFVNVSCSFFTTV